MYTMAVEVNIQAASPSLTTLLGTQDRLPLPSSRGVQVMDMVKEEGGGASGGGVLERGGGWKVG